jgi:hypothetical protein
MVANYLDIPLDNLMTKRDVFELMGYIPLEDIKNVHWTRKTHRILAGGNRSGKSECAAAEIVPYLFWDTRGWIVSDNYDMARVIMSKVIKYLDRIGLRREKKATDLGFFEYSYSARSHRLTMWTGAVLELKSAENPDSMHAVAVDYVVIDEAALFPFEMYDSRLVPRLVDSGGWILSVGTFEYIKGEWFEEYYEIGQTDNDLDIISWKHPTKKNYHRFIAKGGETAQEVAKIYYQNWRKVIQENEDVDWPLSEGSEVIINNVDLQWLEREKKRIDENTYKARYEAEAAPNKYLVFPEWSIQTHVNRKHTRFDRNLPVYLAIDPGGTYAVLAIQLKRLELDGQSYENELAGGFYVCIIDSLYYQTTVTTYEVFQDLKKKEWFPNLSRQHGWWDSYQGAIDATRPETRKAFIGLGRRDKTIDKLRLRVKKVGVNEGIETLQHYIHTKTLFSHPRNRWFHVEMSRYRWTEASVSRRDTDDPKGGRSPKNEWNHAIKALWYFLVQKYGYYGKSSKSAAVSTRGVERKRNNAKAAVSTRRLNRWLKK